MPASACGVVGLKPTFGRVSRAGIVPHSWSLDHAGPLTRTVADMAHMMAVLSGYDPADPACQDRAVPDYTRALGKPIKGYRIGACRNHFLERNQDAVQQAVEAAIYGLAAQGTQVVEFKIPNPEFGRAAIYAIELAEEIMTIGSKTPESGLRVACLQMEPRIGEKSENVARSLTLVEKAARAGAKLVVLPELCNTDYVFSTREEAFELTKEVPGGPTTAAWQQAAASHAMTIVAGITEREGDLLYNSAVVVGPKGPIGRYRGRR
jgi:hypothetical protein